MSDEATEQIASQDGVMAGDVDCDGPVCGNRVNRAETVDVVAGASVGYWEDPVPHVGVTGVGGDPEVEQWCIDCAREWFGIEEPAAGKRAEMTARYVTGRTVAAFLSGGALMLILTMLFIV